MSHLVRPSKEGMTDDLRYPDNDVSTHMSLSTQTLDMEQVGEGLVRTRPQPQQRRRRTLCNPIHWQPRTLVHQKRLV
jgi:hypothetical protein